MDILMASIYFYSYNILEVNDNSHRQYVEA